MPLFLGYPSFKLLAVDLMLTCLSTAASILVVLILRDQKHTHVYLVVTCLQHVVTLKEKHKNNKKQQQFLCVPGKSDVTETPSSIFPTVHPSNSQIMKSIRLSDFGTVDWEAQSFASSTTERISTETSDLSLTNYPWRNTFGSPSAGAHHSRQRGFRACVKMESPTGSRPKKNIREHPFIAS